MQKKYFHYLLILLIVAVVAVALWPGKKAPGDILSINMMNEKNVIYHIHPKIEIEILGEALEIPPNVGVSPNGMKVIHTHDGSGVIHVESPVVHQFYLKDFFTIWGKTFNSQCIVDNCVDDEHVLEFFVNDVPRTEFENYPLQNEDVLRIVYREKEVIPLSP